MDRSSRFAHDARELTRNDSTGSRGPSERSVRIRIARVLAVGFFFVLAGLWFARPLFLHLDDALPFGTTPDVHYQLGKNELPVRPSDIHQVLFHQWLFTDNLAHARNPFANPYEFQPLNTRKLHWLGVWGFPMQLLHALWSWSSPVLALNLVLLATFPITGLVQYALLRRLALRPSLALLGAGLFTFALGRRVQLFCGHMNGALYFTLPLTVLLYLIAVQRCSWRWSCAAGLSVLLWALGEWHMFYFSSLFMPAVVLAIVMASMQGRELRDARRALMHALPLLAGAALGAAYLLYYRAQFIVGSTAEHRTWDELAANSPAPRFLLDASQHLQKPIMFGTDVESAVALELPSLIVLAFALIALAIPKLRGSSTMWMSQERAFLLPVLLCSGLVFALLTTGAHGARVLGLYTVLHRYLPHFDTIRVPGRMIYVVYFALATCLPMSLELVLSGALARSSRAARWGGLVIAGALLAHPIVRAPGVLLSGVLSQSALAPLRAAVPVSDPVLLLPVMGASASASSLAEHFIVATQRATLNGYAPNAPAAAAQLLDELKTLNTGELSREAHNALWTIGVRHVVQLEGIDFLRPSGAVPGYIEALIRKGIVAEIEHTPAYRHLILLAP